VRTQWLSLGFILAGAGCTSMQVVQPAEVIPAQHPAVVLVYTTDGDAATIHSPQIDGDTLRGVDGTGAHYVTALKDIVKMKAPEKNTAKTLALTGFGVGIGAGALWFLTSSGSGHVRIPCQGSLAIEAECNLPAYPPTPTP
jgi:hypothetical protein